MIFDSWQDLLLTIVSIGFVYSLIPQIFLNFKIKQIQFSWQTIIITTVGIYVSAICNFSLDLHFTGITNLITGTCWLTLGIQKIFFERKSSC